jgi:hypothetical protein
MPANAGAFYFTATYVVYGNVDPSWNEIDIGMINNVLGQLCVPQRMQCVRCMSHDHVR